jgi:glucose-6-phosphate isomerase
MPTYQPALDLAQRLLANRTVSRIWDRDVSVWGAAPASADARSIATRLGWLDVPNTIAAELTRLDELGTAAVRETVEAVYLLGMGGSSLCAEVLRAAQSTSKGHPSLFVFDTTDEQTIQTSAARLIPHRTWFLVSSKSGGTVEVASLERFFRSRMEASLGSQAARHFIAITDPGTMLHRLAKDRRYRDVFLNPADIGGRFSVLSLFGLVPAALMGTDPRNLLAAGAAMAEGCRQESRANAGLELGAFIAAAAMHGRDKLTVALPRSLSSFGLWIEQLVAESTGKHGKGALPVVDEPLGRPDEYGSDRAFVALSTERDEPDRKQLDALEEAGHPVLRISTRLESLGSEFFRWEFATAVAGAALGINPFDEPNVAEAKEKTSALLASFSTNHKLPETAPAASSGRLAIHSSVFRGGEPSDVIRTALGSLRADDYVAFLSYLSPGNEIQRAVGEIRLAIRKRHRIATTFGIGPRYLHSTGQYHKGGPNKVVAFVVTSDDATETEIPEAGYSFSVLKRAQALGDTQTLDAHGRRTVRIHVEDQSLAAGAIETLFADALQ